MYKPDCRKCANCYKYGCCRVYGDDPAKAILTCKADGYEAYKFRPRAGKGKGAHHGSQRSQK